MNVLYISYDGMTDPLGQSQVMPYLAGLSAKGHRLFLLSFEKVHRFEKDSGKIRAILNESGITWYPFSYASFPPVFSTLWEIRQAISNADRIIREHQIQIIHCRSYIAALVGLHFRRKKKIPFVFDMRGFWADERVEGGLWKRRNPLYNLIYRYFKKNEKSFFTESDHIISLTHAGKEEILKMNFRDVTSEKITVIPCCTDSSLFKPMPDGPEKEGMREKLQIPEHVPVISYLGSFGTWYMAGEMFDFFKRFLNCFPGAIFLLITRDNPDLVFEYARRRKIPDSAIRAKSATRVEVPVLLSLSHATIFFIKPVFSKRASSPTKMGESLCAGIPVICNDGIGDCTTIIESTKSGIIVRSFTDKAYDDAIANFEALKNMNQEEIRNKAIEYFDLEKGTELYNQVYKNLEKH